MTAKRPALTIGEMTYEQASGRLEEVVGRLESGEVGLDESIALYEEGVALGRRCREILARAEQRVEHLSREAAGLEDGAGGGRAAPGES